jgi:hypothetical protein
MRNLHQLAVWRRAHGLVAVWRRFHGLVAGFLLALVWGAAAVGQEIGGDGASVAEQYLLSAANEERSALNLPALHRDPELARAAVGHAREMAMRGTISHQFAGEAELSARAAETGLRFSVVSENVGEAPSALQLHAMWMHSAEHRANLLDPAVNAAGISVILRRGELYAVEDFAKTVPSLSLDRQEAAIASLVAQGGALAVDLSPEGIAAARGTCSLATGYAGTRKPWFVMRFTSDSVGILPDQLKERIASGRFHHAAVGACSAAGSGPFSSYNLAVMLFP